MQDALSLWVEDNNMLDTFREDLLIDNFKEINKTVYRGVIADDLSSVLLSLNRLSSWSTSKEVALSFMSSRSLLNQKSFLLELDCTIGLDVNATLNTSFLSKIKNEEEIILKSPSKYSIINKKLNIRNVNDVELEYIHLKLKPACK